MAPLQKRALYSLIIGIALTLFLIITLVIQGDVTAFGNDLGQRLVIYAALIGVPLAYLVLVNVSLRRPSQIDERDRLIIERSSHTQWLAVIFSLAAWTIILGETYHDSGQLPVAFLNLMFVFTLIISTLAQSLGILIGYWRMERGG